MIRKVYLVFTCSSFIIAFRLSSQTKFPKSYVTNTDSWENDSHFFNEHQQADEPVAISFYFLLCVYNR